jgi:serine phosphatase RsbU (regulator of sigma subunit)
VWLPLMDGTERIGVMDMTFPEATEALPESELAWCERYAHLVAMLMVSKSAFSDFFEVLRRRRRATVASELVRDLVPPLVFATDDLVIAGLLEPAYDNGGDALDFALNHGVLHFAVFDAMGHGLPAAGVAAFALSAYRHSRRHDDGELEPTYAAMDAAIFAQYENTRFVTALLAQLDVASGRLRWLSAGHPAPLLLRGGRLVKALDVRPAPPIGLRLGDTPHVSEQSLEPGDLLLVYTDGLTEARRPGGDLFTVERLGQFIERQAAAAQTAPETLRRLREAIIDRQEGALRDDASALLVEWRTGGAHALLPQTL